MVKIFLEKLKILTSSKETTKECSPKCELIQMILTHPGHKYKQNQNWRSVSLLTEVVRILKKYIGKFAADRVKKAKRNYHSVHSD